MKKLEIFENVQYCQTSNFRKWIHLQYLIMLSLFRVSVEWTFRKPDWQTRSIWFTSRCAISWEATTLSMILDRKATLAIGRQLEWSVESSPSRLISGTKIERFCDCGRLPFWIDRLQRTVRNGRRTLTSSWSRDVGRGSSSQDLAADERMMGQSSGLMTATMTDKRKSVTG